ncbi:MAG: FixH family protein [Dissulfurispiraceae bacterium]
MSLTNYKTLIVGILIGGFVIIGASIYIGIQKRDVVVEENPYDAGIEYEHALKIKAELGWQVKFPEALMKGERQLVVTVNDKNGKAIKDASIKLQLNRLGYPELQEYKLSGNGNGQYTAMVKLDAAGYWDVSAYVENARDSVRYDDRIYVQ